MLQGRRKGGQKPEIGQSGVGHGLSGAGREKA